MKMVNQSTMTLFYFYLLLLLNLSACFYLPGLAPVSFCEKDHVTETCKNREVENWCKIRGLNLNKGK